MGENTTIGWTATRLPDGSLVPGHTFNPWVGCTKISPACDSCYAEGWAKRTGHPELWDGERRRTKAENWAKPHRWNRKAKESGIRRKVFCASLADVFDNQVPTRWRDDLWHLIDQTPHLDWLLLTKRPQNIAKMLPTEEIGTPAWGNGWPNVWLGTTVANQEEVRRNGLALIAVPARIRFFSCEPLLDWIDPTCIRLPSGLTLNMLTGYVSPDGRFGFASYAKAISDLPYVLDPDRRIHWVIAGGESGGNARPSNPEWFRHLRRRCVESGVPFFFKQWGEWVSVSEVEGRGGEAHHTFEDGRSVRRVGTKRAGNTLDGVKHEAWPVTA